MGDDEKIPGPCIRNAFTASLPPRDPGHPLLSPLKMGWSGYPRGLKGERIPLPARIFAVVDVWDALTSDRPYRKAWSKEKVNEHIKSGSGTHFDPQVVQTFFLEMDKKDNI